MASKDSLLTYQNGDLANIAELFGDRLQSLCLIEKFAMPLTVAIAHQIAEGIYLPEDAE